MLETLIVMNGSVFKKIYGNVNKGICDISVFRRGVVRVFALLGFYAELVGSYRSFGTAYRSHVQGPSGPIGCSETSVNSYQPTLRKVFNKNISEY